MKQQADLELWGLHVHSNALDCLHVDPLPRLHFVTFAPSLPPSLPPSLQWLSAQELWHNLEAVFSNPGTAQEFPEEYVRFKSTHTSWLKVMRRTYETRNVLQVQLTQIVFLTAVAVRGTVPTPDAMLPL